MNKATTHNSRNIEQAVSLLLLPMVVQMSFPTLLPAVIKTFWQMTQSLFSPDFLAGFFPV